MATSIKSAVPGASCQKNKVPKPWYEKEVYCQLIPNEDDRNPDYDIVPRIGAFEISTVFDNVDILIYSKMMSSMWPHVPSVADRIKAFAEDAKSMKGAELKAKYQTTGRQVRAARSPSKRDTMGNTMSTSAAASTFKSAQPVAEPAAAAQPEPVKEEPKKEPEPVKEE